MGSGLGALLVGSGLPKVETQCRGDGMAAGGDGAANHLKKARPRTPLRSGQRLARSQGTVPLCEAFRGVHRGSI